MGLPIVLIVLVATLFVAIALAVVFWRQQKEGKSEILNAMKKKPFLVQLSAGIIISLLGGFFMFDGDILGENTIGIARIMGIVGLVLIIVTNITLQILRCKSTTEQTS